MQAKKRILSVTVKRMVDDSPDTSWLGEYSNKPTSEFSIDRAHTEDCASIEANHRVAVDTLESVIKHLDNWRVAATSGEDYESFEQAEDCLIDLQDTLQECDCGKSGDMNREEYRYFNPSFNYVDKNGHALPGNTPEEVRKYIRQDYERMELLNRGNWCFLGIRADAEVQMTCGPTQRISSGSLWGIESDGGEYVREEEQNQLAELKGELIALGFSKRAIATAFKDVKYKDA